MDWKEQFYYKIKTKFFDEIELTLATLPKGVPNGKPWIRQLDHGLLFFDTSESFHVFKRYTLSYCELSVQHFLKSCLSISYRSVRILLQCILVTARVAKVIISQACVTSTPGGRVFGGVDQGPGHNTPPRDLVTTPPSPGTRSQHLPPSGTWSQHLPPPSGTWSQHLPPSGTWWQHLPPSPLQDMVTTPPSPSGTWSQHLPPCPPPRDYEQAGGTHPTGMHSCSYNFHHFCSL